MPTAKMTTKGQITIPAEVRARYRLHAGTQVNFVENEAGELVLRPKTRDISELRGILKYDGPPVTLEEMDEAIAEGAARGL